MNPSRGDRSAPTPGDGGVTAWEQVFRELNSLGCHPRPDWVREWTLLAQSRPQGALGSAAEALLRGARVENSSREVQECVRACLASLLHADFRAMGSAALPDGVAHLHDTRISGQMVLQVNEISDISIPLRQRFGAPAVAAESDASTSTQQQHWGNRCLKLLLTDGPQQVAAFEYRPVPVLNRDLPAGTKVLVRDPTVRRGMLMLVPEVVQVLGGQVSSLENARQRLLHHVASTLARPSLIAKQIQEQRRQERQQGINRPPNRAPGRTMEEFMAAATRAAWPDPDNTQQQNGASEEPASGVSNTHAFHTHAARTQASQGPRSEAQPHHSQANRAATGQSMPSVSQHHPSASAERASEMEEGWADSGPHSSAAHSMPPPRRPSTQDVGRESQAQAQQMPRQPQAPHTRGVPNWDEWEDESVSDDEAEEALGEHAFVPPNPTHPPPRAQAPAHTEVSREGQGSASIGPREPPSPSNTHPTPQGLRGSTGGSSIPSQDEAVRSAAGKARDAGRGAPRANGQESREGVAAVRVSGFAEMGQSSRSQSGGVDALEVIDLTQGNTPEDVAQKTPSPTTLLPPASKRHRHQGAAVAVARAGREEGGVQRERGGAQEGVGVSNREPRGAAVIDLDERPEPGLRENRAEVARQGPGGGAVEGSSLLHSPAPSVSRNGAGGEGCMPLLYFSDAFSQVQCQRDITGNRESQPSVLVKGCSVC